MYKLMTLAAMVLAETGGAGEFQTSDAGINSVLEKITGVVKDVLMPIIYAGLGLFLIIKGAILGTQIVKAADEPQVRQEKINSLKYLVIGVAIAFGVAIVADVLLRYFNGMLQESLGGGA